MSIGDVCTRYIVTITKTASVAEAAALMRQEHVGDVIVIEEDGGRRYPIGIVTDRDIVVQVVAARADPERVLVGAIMTKELLTVDEDYGITETIRYMREKGVRRVPVLTRLGAIYGIVTLDDLLELLTGELADLARLIRREQRREMRAAP